MKYLILLLIPLVSYADDYSFKYGMGIVNGEKSGTVKMFSLRQESHLVHAAHLAYEGGLWVDNGPKSAGRKGSLFGKAQLGVKPGWQSSGLYGKAFWGVAGLSHTDSQLGGNLQFASDFGVGIRDGSSFIGIGYVHLSSAGIFKPNKGRDFMQLELGVSF